MACSAKKEGSMSRMIRLNELIRREISNTILMREVTDPRLQGVTITKVDTSKDLSVAHVGFSVLDTDPAMIAHAADGLKSASGRIRHLVGGRLDLRRMPELRFEYDNSIVSGMKMTQLLDEISSEHLEEGEEQDGE